MQRSNDNWVVIRLERIKNEHHKWIKPSNHLLTLLRIALRFICNDSVSFLSVNFIESYDFFVLECFFETLQAKTCKDSATYFLGLIVIDGLIALLPEHLDLQVHFFLLFECLADE